MPPQQGYLSTDPNAGQPASAVASAPKQATMPEKSWLDSAKDYLGESLASLNPKAINQGVQSAFWHPIDTIGAIGEAQGALATKAEESFKKGDYAAGMRHALNYLIPILGPRLDQAGDYFQQGEYAKGAGATTDVAIQAMGPKVVKDALPAKATPIMRNPNAAERAAVEFGQQQGVPMDAATATGNPFVRGVQKLADQSLGGSVVGQKAQAAQQGRLATLGEQLASKGYPSAVTAEEAGNAVRQGVRGSVQQQAAAANTAYDALRAFEKATPIPVDISQAKATFTPMYQALMRERELNGVMMGDKARALNALDKLVKAPDSLPLSELDSVLSDLKSFARSDVPELRSVGQGTAAHMVKLLDGQVRQAATNAGPQVIRALEDGRKATTAKYVAGDVLDSLNAEPVRTTKALTAPADSAIEQLRAVIREAPASRPQIGRAVLDGLLDKATEAGGFAHADKLYADWQKLGTRTKHLLYQDPAYIAELDKFFLLAKKLAENPNPSGTALTLAKGGEVSLLMANPAVGAATSISATALSKLLHSRSGVALLTKGLRIPSGNQAATAAYAADVARVLGDLTEMGTRLPSYAGSGETRK